MAYEDQLAEMMDEIMHLEHKLHGERRKNRALERKIADSEETWVEIQVLHRELIKEKRAKTALKTEVAEKDAELDSLRHHAAHCEATSAKKDAEIESLQQEIDNMQLEKEAAALEKIVLDFDQIKLKIAKCRVRIYVKCNPSLALTVRDGKVIVSQSDENDLHQYWMKDDEYGQGKTDCFGCVAFALVNIATGQAMKPAAIEGIDTWEPVQLVTYDPHVFDQSILWSQGTDRRDNYRTIRTLTNSYSNLDALGGSEVHDGNNVGLFKFHHGTNQMWKVVP